MRITLLRSWILLGWAASMITLPATARAADPISIVITLPAEIYLGQDLDAVIEVTNAGDESLTGIAIKTGIDECGPVEGPRDDVDGDGVMTPGESWRYQCVLGWFGSDHLHVAVTGTTSGGMAVTGSSSVSYVWLDPIRCDFTASPTAIEEGATVEWEIAVTNVGPTRLTALAAETRILWPGWVGPIPTSTPAGPFESAGNGDAVLDPGEVWTYRHSEAVSVDTSFLDFGLVFDADHSPGTHLGVTARSPEVRVVPRTGGDDGAGDPHATLPYTGADDATIGVLATLAATLVAAGVAIGQSNVKR